MAEIKAAFLALTDPNDWTGDGQPEGWKMIDRAFTKAEARYIPNGANSTADMAHPTRTGDLVVFSYPPYQFDAATPGTLVARSAFFGQHGYVPDVQNLDANVNMRATFIAGGGSVLPNLVASGLRTIDLAPTVAYLLGVPAPQHSQGVVRLDLIRGGEARTLVPILSLTDFHGQLDPTTELIRGPDAIRQAFAGPPSEWQWEPVGAGGADDGSLGFTVGEATIRRALPSGGEVTTRSKYLTIWTRMPDGGVRFVVDGGNGR